MHIGIIIHSHTGNTLAAAEIIKSGLTGGGHTAEIRRVRAENEDPSAAGNIRLSEEPAVNGFDALIFGAPVRGFSMSPVMALYLKGLSPLGGRPVACFVTQHFKSAWLGGNRSVKQMRAACAAAGAEVYETGVVNWSSENRRRQIDGIAERFARRMPGQ